MTSDPQPQPLTSVTMKTVNEMLEDEECKRAYQRGYDDAIRFRPIPTAPCPQHKIWQHCPVAATIRNATLDRLDKEIATRENEMNRRAGLEDNIVTVSGFYASAGALNWVRVVLIDALRTPITPKEQP